MRKGVRETLILPLNDNVIRYVDENAEVFKAVIARDFDDCEFEIYEGTYQDTDIIAIDVIIIDKMQKIVDADLRRFKEEVRNHFGYRPTKIYSAKFTKII